jgi:hypothetical protein
VSIIVCVYTCYLCTCYQFDQFVYLLHLRGVIIIGIVSVYMVYNYVYYCDTSSISSGGRAVYRSNLVPTRKAYVCVCECVCTLSKKTSQRMPYAICVNKVKSPDLVLGQGIWIKRQ